MAVEPSQGLDLMVKAPPVMVVVDRAAGGDATPALCKTLRQQGSRLPLLLIMARDQVEDRIACLESGADDYLLKPYRSEEFLKLVCFYLKTEVTEHEQLRFADLVLDLGLRQVLRNGRSIDLTLKEFELLKFLMEHPREVLPREQIEQVQPQAFASNPQNIYIADGIHVPVTAILPGGNRLAVGEKTSVEFQTTTGKPLKDLLAEYPETEIIPSWTITKGENLVRFDENGNLEALSPGDVTLQGKVPGLATNKGFLFIKALGRVGAFDQQNGKINWDILGMVLFFGISLYINQLLSGQGSSGDNPQQAAVNRFTPIIFSGMFLFFPLPAGVLMYMVIANIFQTLQTYILSREPLPENLQKLVVAQEAVKSSGAEIREALRLNLPARRKRRKNRRKTQL
ncbi:MAG: membrane protein insertase YidC [Leptolyngbyaceae cyanobacterium CRU_2_3]|nr:membrane protein insertase YidC [Leptolyngbyaceae cyanobacterium CRU_2_3]